MQQRHMQQAIQAARQQMQAQRAQLQGDAPHAALLDAQVGCW
jgi:hypothetical protein